MEFLHEVEHGVESGLHELEEGLFERELIAQSKHKKTETALLLIRNIAVGFAALLFVISLCSGVTEKELLRAIGYFLGAAAYFSEVLMLTEFFQKHIAHAEVFMAYCFGPIYILMGINYLVEYFEHLLH